MLLSSLSGLQIQDSPVSSELVKNVTAIYSMALAVPMLAAAQRTVGVTPHNHAHNLTVALQCPPFTCTSSVKKNFVRFLDSFLVMCAGDVLVCICILFARTYPDDFHERIGQQH